jgi:hypothetical protein
MKEYPRILYDNASIHSLASTLPIVARTCAALPTDCSVISSPINAVVAQPCALPAACLPQSWNWAIARERDALANRLLQLCWASRCSAYMIAFQFTSIVEIFEEENASMSDPLSTTASVMTVIAFAAESSKILFKVFRGVTSMPIDVQASLQSLKSLHETMNNLQQTGTKLDPNHKFPAHFCRRLNECLNDLEALEAKIDNIWQERDLQG